MCCIYNYVFSHVAFQAIQSSFPSNGTVLGVASVPFSDDLMTVAVAIFAVGGMMGALPAGVIADYIGRYCSPSVS